MYIPYKQIRNWHSDKIDLLNITIRNKKHDRCKLKIKNSKNNVHRGLYCCNHKKWLQWINYDQELFLKEMGIEAESPEYEDLFWS